MGCMAQGPVGNPHLIFSSVGYGLTLVLPACRRRHCFFFWIYPIYLVVLSISFVGFKRAIRHVFSFYLFVSFLFSIPSIVLDLLVSQLNSYYNDSNSITLERNTRGILVEARISAIDLSGTRHEGSRAGRGFLNFVKILIISWRRLRHQRCEFRQQHDNLCTGEALLSITHAEQLPFQKLRL
ncbi:hypothetical protein T440DRAFT_285716 [Plenodomus tracheiphilus IPT5]|uniref:Transmembrane protein n=1 Tax=Plenodomus tracheiphilus IPT5 TaxID=1408161 RepID=A0A6A7BDU4_9PLEO|nr:hypothetical protein T440DRAFT_285716 [Plenodomus tracheiphilus IPT5]